MKKKGTFFMILALTSALGSACNTAPSMDGKSLTEVSEGDEPGTFIISETVIRDTEDTIKLQDTFADPFVDGTLNYTIQGYQVYDNIEDAGIPMDALMEPYNRYASQDIGEQYRTVEDFVSEEGKIVDSHTLVVLDVEIENVDAVGRTKKNEFSVSNFSLRGGENVNQYNVSYFTLAGITSQEQPLHYQLEQGETIEIQLAYFVQKEDMENLIGVIPDSPGPVQFFIK